jgi:hypothetical protein
VEYLLGVLIGLAGLAAIGVAGYFVLRRMFERVADRVADQIGVTLAEVSGRAAATRAGQRTTAAARTVVSRWTNWDAYARAKGESPETARREFAESIERIARIMDAAVRLPVVGPVGLDSLLGLFPVAGDAVSAGVSVYLIATSLKYGVPHDVIARMLANVLVDMLLGAVPVAGDIADLMFRANVRNVAILREYLDAEAQIIDVTPQAP